MQTSEGTAPSHPYLTSPVRGIGGVIRVQPEDFQVEELSLYLPSGDGEHLYLRVTKRGLSTPDMVKAFASVLGVKAQQIGVAGLKDARAVTTQMVSVQGTTPEAVSRLTRDPRIMEVEVLGRHRNRLRTGHHAGNRFRLVIRDVVSDAERITAEVLGQLSRRGLPNYFGSQRQGRGGQNYRAGARLLRDSGARRRMSRSQRLWFLHAYQSYLFNQIVAARIDTVDRLHTGDWAIKHVNGACFAVEDPMAEQPRADAFEISPTGILFGSRVSWATGVPGTIEQGVVAAHGETPASLTEAARACGFRGERRALRVPLRNMEWMVADRVVTVTVTLPPGAYATSLLRELMKDDAAAGRG